MAVTFERIELEGRSLRENVGQKEEVSKHLRRGGSMNIKEKSFKSSQW